MKVSVRWPDRDEILDRAQEKVVELFEGAVSFDVAAHERISPLQRFRFDIYGKDGEILGHVNIDIYPGDDDDMIAEIEFDDEHITPLSQVYTSREAAALWGLSVNTVTQWCNRGRFLPSEARKSEKVWLVTHAGMVRLTGRDPE